MKAKTNKKFLKNVVIKYITTIKTIKKEKELWKREQLTDTN